MKIMDTLNNHIGDMKSDPGITAQQQQQNLQPSSSGRQGLINFDTTTPPAATTATITGDSSIGSSSSTNNKSNAVGGLKLLSQFNESSRTAISNLILREKRCRAFERESNELRDVICSQNHFVHILENIRRVSRDYIHHLYELIGFLIKGPSDGGGGPEVIEQLQQEVSELEQELKHWERKYHMVASLNAMSGSSSSLNHNNPLTNGTTGVEHFFGQQPNGSTTMPTAVTDVAPTDLLELVNRRLLGEALAAAACPNVVPTELCEMSMETATTVDEPQQIMDSMMDTTAFLLQNNSPETGNRSSNIKHHQPATRSNSGGGGGGGIHSSATVSANIPVTNSIHRQHQVPSSPGSAASSSMANSNVDNHHQRRASSTGKPMFRCEHPNCDYQTNMRQRLAMHKRSHAGELLYSCDVPGCGYESNYKGNIKIHKKHRHRIESSATTTSIGPDDTDPNANNSNNRTIQRKTAPAAPTIGSRHRTRGRKRKFRSTPVIAMEDNNSQINGINSGSENNSIPGSGVPPPPPVTAIINSKDNQQTSSSSSVYQCQEDGCGYRSKWKQCLTAHQFLHAGVKPYKCDHPGCNYRTNFKGNVNVHKRVHRASGEYQCHYSGCTFSTPWKNSFLIHLKNHGSTVNPSLSSQLKIKSEEFDDNDDDDEEEEEEEELIDDDDEEDEEYLEDDVDEEEEMPGDLVIDTGDQKKSINGTENKTAVES